ncbi:hypothetical protein C1H46_030440 [Malus baccata]|uniref:Uncharacterized protein n=1 Tax=Malus baccata TaxID=106549 RepID=A0A540LC27_MALBA|nr:hypothetical protein C1H46_030440 [Malus baccata]
MERKGKFAAECGKKMCFKLQILKKNHEKTEKKRKPNRKKSKPNRKKIGLNQNFGLVSILAKNRTVSNRTQPYYTVKDLEEFPSNQKANHSATRVDIRSQS